MYHAFFSCISFNIYFSFYSSKHSDCKKNICKEWLASCYQKGHIVIHYLLISLQFFICFFNFPRLCSLSVFLSLPASFSFFHFFFPLPLLLCPLGWAALGLPTFNPLSLRSVFSVPPRTLRVAAWQRCHSAFSFLLFFRPLVCVLSDSFHLCPRPPTFALFSFLHSLTYSLRLFLVYFFTLSMYFSHSFLHKFCCNLVCFPHQTRPCIVKLALRLYSILSIL